MTRQSNMARLILACTALCLPTLLAYNLPPSSTFLNQAAALIGWGGWLAVLAGSLVIVAGDRRRDVGALQLALVLLLLAAFASPFWASLPWSLSLSAVALIGAAALAAQTGAASQRSGQGIAAFRAFCIALVVAGLLSSVVGTIQVFAPSLADGNVIARTYIEGRAVGNMRQPNHLSSLLIWAIIAAVWLGELGVARRWVSSALALVFVFVVVLSGSRTGTLSIHLLAVWGLLDRRLSRQARVSLVLAPLVYWLCWFGVSAWADQSHHVFGGESRFSAKGDISSSRYAIWSNTLALIRMHPWVGVGFGEFNFAWTLTPFPDRPVAFFDHTHNLLLQFAVELGLPLAALVLGLLGWALFCALRGAVRAGGDADAAQAPMKRAAFMMVLMILLHSLLEYPLWYAYFLLPAAFAFGICLGEPLPPSARAGGAAAGRPRLRWLPVASLLLLLGGLASLADYARVVVIFAPPENAAPLADRIADGRRSVFFSHHADYAAATTAARPGDVLSAFRGAPHNLLDSRLLEAWAKALAESGDIERARYVAQRLKEFRNEQAAPFFAPCEVEPEDHTPLPFQCTPPTREFTYEDFR